MIASTAPKNAPQAVAPARGSNAIPQRLLRVRCVAALLRTHRVQRAPDAVSRHAAAAASRHGEAARGVRRPHCGGAHGSWHDARPAARRGSTTAGCTAISVGAAVAGENTPRLRNMQNDGGHVLQAARSPCTPVHKKQRGQRRPHPGAVTRRLARVRTRCPLASRRPELSPALCSTYGPYRMNMVHSAQWMPQSLLPREQLLPQQPQGHALSHWFEVRNEQAQARWRRTPRTSARPRAVAQAPCPRPPALPAPARGLGVGRPAHPPRQEALR
jgi:hypothetical protein